MSQEAPQSPSLSPETASLCLRALLASCHRSISFKDADGRFLAMSRHLAKTLDVEPAGRPGPDEAGCFSERYTEATRAEEESVMATHDPVIGKLEKIEWKDGRETWAHATRLPLHDANGRSVGTITIVDDVTEAQHVAHVLEQTRRDLMDASRVAGMAEVATGVLHNVGNVLTSLNVSATVLANGMRQSKAESLARIAELLETHRDDLASFMAKDPKGRRVPEFIETLSRHMIEERDRLLGELTGLQQNIDHIKEIVTMQQAYATMAGVLESLDPAALVEDALRMNTGTLLRHSVSVVRELHTVPNVRGERAKVLQILVNLIRNAKYALDDGGKTENVLTLRVARGAERRVQIAVEDNGIGIRPEHMARLFQRGFTTRPTGHGFGLHSARQAALDIGATLTAHSEGLGKGAVFTLDLPACDPLPQQ